jgi:hypothetical protein
MPTLTELKYVSGYHVPQNWKERVSTVGYINIYKLKRNYYFLFVVQGSN